MYDPSANLDGVQSHIDAVAAGETIESRVELVRGSNYLSDEAKRVQVHFVKAFAMMAALEPFAGTTIDFGDGLKLRLNKPRPLLEGNELPGVRTDYDGWLVIEGDYIRDGKRLARRSREGNPLWPLMIRNPPIFGSGPWGNFLPQSLDILHHAGLAWPRDGRK